ncbi:MAG TPA: tetratricopeptide repeat protein [Kofleriaceae bacterium]|nr:tetratricopeptide repeat protein [Kofleriaceae bacterium]
MSRSATATSLLAVCILCSVAGAQRPNQGEDESAAFVEEGRQALRKGDLDDAAKSLDQALSLNPRRVEAYVLRSAVFAARKQYKDGIALMRKAQLLAPQDGDVLTALGSQLVLSGDVTAGVPLLEQVAAKEPARYDAQLLLGRYFHDTAKWPESINALELYFSYRPKQLAKEDPRHRVELADSYLRSGQPAKALPLFETAAAATPKNDLRARIGIAWSTAAMDCKKARGMLKDLEPIAEQGFAEIWLVDGQCALALGDPNGALALGRRYLERAESKGKGSAAGHALVGEAHAARGNLPDARKELELAASLEPQRRRWTVRLAVVLRRANAASDAQAVLEKLGPPASPAVDPDWWSELGETLLAQNQNDAVVAKLTPVVAELPTHAATRVVLGTALLATSKPDDAVKILDEAETIQSTPRGKKLLAEALTTVAVGKLAANDAAAAEPLLSRADQLDGNPLIWRNLGIAKLALDKKADAVAVLDKAAKADASAIVAMLDGRAHAVNGDIAGARPLYERALNADKDNAEIAIDWAASEIAAGDPAIAVSALEKTAATAAKGPLAARHKAALATARHAAGLAQLRAGNGTKAVELLRAAATPGEATIARKCDLAVAAVVAGDNAAALAALRAVQGQTCPFPTPADTQAVPILIAFTDGLNAKKAPAALTKLTTLGGKSTGIAAQLLGTSIRVVALNAAQDAYRGGQLAPARKYLATARGANAKVGTDEVAHNLAVLDLVDGKVDAAIAQLEKLTPRVPEAWINLGVAYEKKGDHAKALDAWRKARKMNVRFAPLNDWIEAKERVYGGEAP